MKLNHLFNSALAGVIACALWSCDTIKEEDRLIYVKPAEVNRSVLIEDFTGQRCVNCPTATEEIEKLQEQYGDAVIAVGIHSGPFGHRTTMSSPRLSLCTETGDDYYNYWKIEAQPSVMINRSAPISNTAEYGTVVRGALEKTTPLDLVLETEYDADKRSVAINISATTSENISGKLQVWVVENNIVDVQYMPDGSPNMEYLHQHVFRTSVTNDIFGDNFSATDETIRTASYQVTLDETWKAEDVAIIAFVSNSTDGVLQVVKTALFEKDETTE